MEFLLIVFWLAFAGAVGMFAHVRRNRFGFGWFLLALIISPLLAGIFVAILKEGEEETSINLSSEAVSVSMVSTDFYLKMIIAGAVIIALPIMAILATH